VHSQKKYGESMQGKLQLKKILRAREPIRSRFLTVAGRRAIEAPHTVQQRPAESASKRSTQIFTRADGRALFR
jgi:hypothetical protein